MYPVLTLRHEYAKARMLSHNRGYVANDPINSIDRTGAIGSPPSDFLGYMDDLFQPGWDWPFRPDESGKEGRGDGGGGRDIEKQWRRLMECNKSGDQVISDMVSNFGKYANYNGFAVPGDVGYAAIRFAPGRLEVGRVIDIDHLVSVLLGVQPINVELTSRVKVISITSTSITFEPVPGDHPLIGTITFAASSVGDGELQFSVSVSADPADFFYKAFFKYLGGAEFEDAVWKNLLNNVQRECQR